MAKHKPHQGYIFSPIPPDEGYTFGSANLLFNQPSHLKAKNLFELISYSVWNEVNRRESIRIYLSIVEGKALSLPSSPFGSVEIFEDLPENVIIDFLLFIVEKHPDTTIRHYPFIYNRFGFSEEVFLKSGFKLLSEDTGHYLDVKKDFEEHISGMELRKLKKSKRDGLIVTQLGLEYYEEVFQFIERCRIEKGQVLSLDQYSLKQQLLANPEHYLLFVVFKADQMVAATIAVRVSDHVVYHFYPATDAEFITYSPMVLLTMGLYNFCLTKQVKYLDLGTSMLNNLPNKSLIHFKEQLGGKPYQKSTYKTIL